MARFIVACFRAGIKQERPLDDTYLRKIGWEVAVFFCLVFPSLHQSRKERCMSMYPIKELLSLWAQGKLLTEQAIGQIMQHILNLSTRLARWRNACKRWNSRHLRPKGSSSSRKGLVDGASNIGQPSFCCRGCSDACSCLGLEIGRSNPFRQRQIRYKDAYKRADRRAQYRLWVRLVLLVRLRFPFPYHHIESKFSHL